MASNYKKIAEEHERRYGWDAKPRRIYKKLYSDKTHFIYELIQNADDSESGHLQLQLESNALFVWNDGRQFKAEDVRRICSLGSSDKDLTHIGTFGIGFKAVYNYTDLPEIYSSDERFRIRDFIKPESIGEITPEIEKLLEESKTIFRLPFKGRRHQIDDIEHLKNRLCNLSKERSLLFLRNLERIEWKDERNTQTGSYSCQRCSCNRIQNIPENESVELVTLTRSLNGSSKLSETFLVFRRKVHPPKDVIDKLLEQAEDEEDKEEQQRIQQSGAELQPIEVAFKLQDDRIITMDDNCVLFAYLPTQKKTHLKFLIQARYQTTPARDNIPNPSENPWNGWLVAETANYLPQILEVLKEGGYLKPQFFNVIPLEKDLVFAPEAFDPIAEALRQAMRTRAFAPTEKEGHYAKAENVFYPHRGSLRKLIECSWIYPNSSWLHPDIRRSSRAFDVMREAGVKEINVSQVLNWLEKQDLNWFEDRCEKWLRSLYVYLLKYVYPNNQKFQLERIKKLPLIRLENGKHVSAAAQSVFFAPDTDEAREEIESFLKDLPIFQSSLLSGEECGEIKGFLENHLGVRSLRPETLIRKWMIPQYSQSEKPSEKENISHVRYLFKVWDKLSGYERRSLREEISETPILRAYNGTQPDICDFVKPCDASLPKAYTGDADLETYFSVCDGDTWFVDHTYLEDDSNRKIWLQFLKAIGSIDTPRVDKVEVVGSAEECKNRGITRERSTRPYIGEGSFKESYYSGYFDGGIVDSDFAGLLEVFAQISSRNDVNLSRPLWNLLVKIVEPLSSEKPNWSMESRRDAFFQCTYHRFYHAPQRTSFDATFYRQLKETAWLPDEQGNLHQPSELFAPTDNNRRVLGDSMPYLHSDFDVSTEPTQWLAQKLGVHLNADTNSVLKYLQTLSNTETTVETIEPIYRFLARQDARPREEFEQKPLIFTSNPEPRWWRSNEVFWKDESKVFGDHCGYLEKNYADYETTLKPFFVALGVRPDAAPSDSARVIREVASAEQAENPEVRERLKNLYHRLWQPLREGSGSLEDEEWQKEWEQTRASKCWLGKKGGEWDFYSLQELIWNDHNYRAEIFEGELPFWGLSDELLEFTKGLGIKGCSQAKVEFLPSGNKEDDADWSRKMRGIHRHVHAFLKSPRLCEEPVEEKFIDVLAGLSVCRVNELKVIYELKGIPVIDPNPRQSFLDVSYQQSTLWLGPEENGGDDAELVGDALQDYFGCKELGRFVENLLTKDPDRVLSSWKRKGLQTDLCIPSREMEGEDNNLVMDEADKSEPHFSDDEDNKSAANESEVETPMESETPEADEVDNDLASDRSGTGPDPSSSIGDIRPSDTQTATKTESTTTQPINRESKGEAPTGNKSPEIRNRGVNSKTEKSETHTHTSRTSRTHLSSSPRERVSIPGNNVEDHSEHGEKKRKLHTVETNTSSHDRREIEHIGMECARRYEEGQGRTVEDVSAENLGFDLRSTSNSEMRCIEVKARADRSFVVLTSNEWSVGEQRGDNYFLYVVLSAQTQPELYIIQNPTGAVSPTKQVNVTYQVTFSEIMKRGQQVVITDFEIDS